MAQNLRQQGYRLLAVDFDPEAVQRHAQEGYTVHYGDAEDPEFIASLPLAKVKWVVSTVRDPHISSMLLHGLQQQNYQGKVALSTSSRHDAELLRQRAVELVLVPYADAAREAADQLTSYFSESQASLTDTHRV